MNSEEKRKKQLAKREIWRTTKFATTLVKELSSTTRKLFRKWGYRRDEVKAFRYRPLHSRRKNRNFWVYVSHADGRNSFSDGHRVTENIRETSEQIWNNFCRLGKAIEYRENLRACR